MGTGIGRILNSTIKILVHSGALPKVEVFADYLDGQISGAGLIKRLNGLTPVTLEEFWMMAGVIRSLDRTTTAYPFLVRSVMQDQEIRV